jgi:hypothetical protein
MKCGANGDTTCMARQGNQCMEHLITDTPSCPSRVPLTNADRIRSMSDEELARFLGDEPPYLSTYDKYLDWLRQPAKEEHNETD